MGSFLSYVSGLEVEGSRGLSKGRRKGEMDLHSSKYRSLLALGLMAILVIGGASVASAAITLSNLTFTNTSLFYLLPIRKQDLINHIFFDIVFPRKKLSTRYIPFIGGQRL